MVNVLPPKSSRRSLPALARVGDVGDGPVEPADRELVDVAHDRDDEPVVDRDRDAHVDAPLGEDARVGPVGVERRVALERLDRRLDHERHVAERDALALLVLALGLLARPHEPRGVHLHVDPGLRDRQRTGHLGRDALAHLGHRQEDFVGAVGERDRRAGRGRGRGARRGGHDRDRGRAAGPDRLDHREHVVAGDPVATARALDLLGAQAVLAQQAPHGRGHARVGVTGRRERRGGRERRRCRGCGRGGRSGHGSCRSGGCGGGLGRRRRGRSLVGAGRAARGLGGRGRRRCRRRCGGGGVGFVAGVDDRDLGVVGDGRALLGQDLLEDALERRRDLGIDLVGDDLEERLVLVDVVADLLEPFPDRPLGDALAELGHRHLRHVRSSSGLPDVARSVPHPAIPVEPGRSQDDRAVTDASPPRPRRLLGNPGCPAPRGRRARRRGPRPRS